MLRKNKLDTSNIILSLVQDKMNLIKQNELKDNIIKDLKNKISKYEGRLLCQK